MKSIEFERVKTVIKNGIEYEFTQPYNDIVAEQMDGEKECYSIKHKTSCYKTDIIKVLANKEEKNIGTMVYLPSKKMLVLHKFIKATSHQMVTTNEYGVSNDIFAHLPVNSKIVFHVGNIAYTTTVTNMIKKGNYKNFKHSYNGDLQIFINLSDLKCIDNNVTKKKQKKTKRLTKK